MALIKAALADLALQNLLNYTQTAKKFNINRSTLSRHYKGKTVFKKKGRQTRSILSNQKKKILLIILISLQNVVYLLLIL